MEEHQDELDDGADGNELAQQFMEEYNASLRSKNVITLPQTADDYMELAENAGAKKKKLEYPSKALELEPDNLYGGLLGRSRNAAIYAPASLVS